MKPNDLDGSIPIGDEQEEQTTRKNVLVQWKGGGYDGCLWEPNTGYFDEDGDWYPIISTGYGGRDTLEEFERKKDDADDLYFPLTVEGLLEFAEYIRDDALMQTLRVLEEAGINIAWRCTDCERIFRDMDSFSHEFTGYRGDGGIGVIMEGPLCHECECLSRCTDCQERSDPGTMFMGICADCLNARRWDNEAIDEEMAELEEVIEKSEKDIQLYLLACPHKDPDEVRRTVEQTVGKWRRRIEALKMQLMDD
jgi:hypothetical protein